MKRLILMRLGLLALIILGVLTITFVISRVLPGDPAGLMLGGKPTAEQMAAARESLGLDRPLVSQYGSYLLKVAHGDWGESLRTRQPVTADLARLVPATIELVSLAMLVALLAGIPLGVQAAVRQGRAFDAVSRVLAIAGGSVPAFVLAILLQLLLHGQLGVLPLQGRIDADVLLDHPFPTVTGFHLMDTALAGNWVAWRSAAAHLVLPVLTLAVATLPTVFRVARNLMADALGAEHVRMLEAYGMPARRIHYRYALRATLIPLLTVVGLTYGYLLGGSIIVEYVFDWPGIGSYVVNGVIVNDFPAVLGVTMVLAASYLVINLLVDLAYYALDPRISGP